jgi:hypothetical protein
MVVLRPHLKIRAGKPPWVRAWCAESPDRHFRGKTSAPTFSRVALCELQRQQTSASSVLSCLIVASLLSPRDEGQFPCAGAIACLQLSSQLCALGVPDFFTMRSFDRRSFPHTIHKWHKNRRMDFEPENPAAAEMAIGSCTGVC